MNKKYHVKLGDVIKITTGNHRGIIGKIKFIARKKSILFIEGVPPRLKKIKKNISTGFTEIEVSVPIHISNVILWRDSPQ